MKIAFLFPGQGAQHVGMGHGLYQTCAAGKRVFDQAEAITAIPLKRLCFEGPEEELSRTDIAQPAIFTVSVAMLECIHDHPGADQLQAIQPAAMAGLSLGEYTALYAAGAMDFQTGLKLVARRGELMQDAATATPSGMVSILGLDEEKARELCEAAGGGQVLACANFNCPGQIVLSGEKGACERAARLADSFGAKGAIPLKVAGAFHSELMAPAAEQFAKALDEVDFAEPKAAVIANVDARPYENADRIKDKLLRQLTSPVRWQQSMEFLLAEGVEKFYEIGPGRVLAGLMRRIDRRADVVCINGREMIEKLAEVTGTES